MMRYRSAVAVLLLVSLAVPAQAAKCIRGPWIQNAGVGAITIRWELDVLGPSNVDYWQETPEAKEAPVRLKSPFLGRKHRVTLTKLRPGDRYTYRILSGDKAVTEEFTFRATPAEPSKLTFAVFGDFGTGGKDQLAVARLLEQSPAEFALLCGDIIYGRGEEEHYDLKFFEPYKNVLPRMTFWPALGNHDVGSRTGTGPLAKGGAAALSVFETPLNGPTDVHPGLNYSFDYGNAHIAAINSNASEAVMREKIGPWLVKDMQASDKPWKFVFFHHPPYSSASHGENAKMRDVMVPFFQQAKIDITFGGHDHSYERTKPIGGIVYIVSGNGGNRLYEHKNPHDYTAKFYNEKHGLTLVTLEGGKLLLRHINVDGEEIDRLTLSK